MTQPIPTILPQSHVTLHYRITLTGEHIGDFLSTFNGHPATVAIGQAQLAPFIESRLLGLPEGAHATFSLSADEAFGAYNTDLVQTVGAELLTQTNPQAGQFAQGDFVHFNMPNGAQMTGQFQHWLADGSAGVVDFNHPLAGKPLQLEVQIIGVL